MTKLQDVARQAGVSAATVSRVINEPALVNGRTRARVQQVIAEMGYHPSRVARRLRVESGRSNLIGLVIPDIQNPFFADIVRGVEDAAQRHGYAVFLGNADEDLDKERRYLEVMRSEAVDGVILPPSCETDTAAAQLVRDGIPVVCVDRRLATVHVDTVMIDNVQGAYEATEHLLAHGHRRVGFISGRLDLSTSRERVQGFRRALEDRGIPMDPELVLSGDGRQESGRELATRLLALPEPPTALVAGNNLMALGALEAIHERGLRIPEQVAIIGYDDTPWARALNPPLTTVRQPGYELGSRAMELLLQRMEQPDRGTSSVLLHPTLVVRRSCGG